MGKYEKKPQPHKEKNGGKKTALLVSVIVAVPAEVEDDEK